MPVVFVNIGGISNLTYLNKKDEMISFDSGPGNFLIDKLNVKTLKIGSGEVTNGPLLMAHAKKNQNLILSTGMSNLIEVKEALSVIAYGYLNLDIKFFFNFSNTTIILE